MKNVLTDLLFCFGWLIVCGVAGGVFNEFRTNPLPLTYSSAADRLNQEVDQLRLPSTQSSVSTSGIGDVNRSEMLQIVASHSSVVIDARPAIFYRLAHIPSALSLPRDDFENQYKALKATLEPIKAIQSIVVYCADQDCHDGEMVAEALRKLGYRHVRLYSGGWSDWQAAQGSEEK